MNKKIILLALFLIVCSISTQASLLRHYWCDDTSGTTLTDSSTNGVDGTVSSENVWDADGILERSCYFNLSYYATVAFGSELSDWTFMTWFKLDDTAPNSFLFHRDEGTTGMYIESATNIVVRTTDNEYDEFAVAAMTAGTWYHVIVTNTAGEVRLYINNSESASSPIADETILNNDTFYISASVGPDNYVDGRMDDIRVYDEVVSSATRTFVFNGGTGTQEGTPTPSAEEFTVTAIDAYDNSSIKNFTVIIYNSTDAYINTTIVGNITFGNISAGNYSINITKINDSGGYFNLTIASVNASSDLEAVLHQAVIYINASEVITGTPIVSFTAESASISNASNATGWAKLLMKAGSYDISADATGYVKGWAKVSISPFDEKLVNVTLGTSNFTIKAKSTLTGLYIQNFSINLTHTSYNYKINKSTTNASIVFKTILGNYNLSFKSKGYADAVATYEIVSGNMFPNYTFTIYTENSINFTFYDEITEVKINGTAVTLDLVAEGIFANNYTTENGTLYIDLLTPAEYRIIFNAEGYEQRYYYFTVSNDTHNELDLYLLDSGNATSVNLYLTDMYDNVLLGYYVYLMRHYVSSNTYKTMEIIKTDENGMVRHNIVLNDVFYKWTFKNTEKITIKTTIGQPIYLTTLTYKLQIEEPFLQQYSKIGDIAAYISHDNDTGLITFGYSGTSDLSGKYCLKVEQLTAFNFQKVYDFCQTTSTGTISYTITDFGANYMATGYTIQRGSPDYITNLVYRDIFYKMDWKTKFGGTGLLLDAIFIMAMSIIGYGMAGPFGAVILGTAGVGVFWGIGIIALRLTTYIGICIFAIILAIRLKK